MNKVIIKRTRLALLSLLIAMLSACATTVSHEEGGIGGTGHTEQQLEE